MIGMQLFNQNDDGPELYPACSHLAELYPCHYHSVKLAQRCVIRQEVVCLAAAWDAAVHIMQQDVLSL